MHAVIRIVMTSFMVIPLRRRAFCEASMRAGVRAV